ncbi:MAG: hypothetical protein M2R45_03529 [Verrucomicrobia subdivision 3 bacterium]|nr:hypothetical protein [Limisphaerales bacterium]MCS1415926.1 hypothetical protein [Limisphaerales bacterium]
MRLHAQLSLHSRGVGVDSPTGGVIQPDRAKQGSHSSTANQCAHLKDLADKGEIFDGVQLFGKMGSLER